MKQSVEGPWRIATYNPDEKCPVDKCNGSVKQFKGCNTPIPFYRCDKCDVATWAIHSNSIERRNKVKELSNSDFKSFYRWVNEEKVKGNWKKKEEYWAYVLKTHQKEYPYYYVGATSHDPRYRLLQHSIPEHKLNSPTLMNELRKGRNGKPSPWLIRIIGPFNTRLESLYAESILHMAYEKQYGNKYVFGDFTKKIIPWKELKHKPPKELREHLQASEDDLLSARP
ncbi:MAG: hypothetical protein PVJ94_03515 [Flavobacteriales bacterium]|jgi:hypothetical protein